MARRQSSYIPNHFRSVSDDQAVKSAVEVGAAISAARAKKGLAIFMRTDPQLGIKLAREIQEKGLIK